MKTAKPTSGFTLLEISMVLAIVTLVTGALFAMSIGIGDTARLQESQTRMNEGARAAIQAIAAELRQAQAQSVTSTLPGESLNYRMATDLDGNGTAVDKSGRIELGPRRTIKRDLSDMNGDGLTRQQLIIATDTAVLRVLTNNLCPTTETTDANGNGIIDRGFWVASSNGGFNITVQTEATLRNGRKLATVYTEFVRMRN